MEQVLESSEWQTEQFGLDPIGTGESLKAYEWGSDTMKPCFFRKLAVGMGRE